jgi:hypothetical protein
MTTLSNSYMQKTFSQELYDFMVSVMKISKSFLYKHHKVIGYF